MLLEEDVMDDQRALVEKTKEMIKEFRDHFEDRDALLRSHGIDPAQLPVSTHSETSPEVRAEVERILNEDFKDVDRQVAQARENLERANTLPLKRAGKHLRKMI